MKKKDVMLLTGPGLRVWDSHSSIHEAALGEAQELTDMFEAFLRRGNLEQALHLAYIAVEHWETRTLRHAESEEEGLYPELTTANPDLHDAVVALSRDHTLMRQLVRDIKVKLDEGDIGAGILQRLQALVLIDVLHNQEEEQILTARSDSTDRVEEGAEAREHAS